MHVLLQSYHHWLIDTSVIAPLARLLGADAETAKRCLVAPCTGEELTVIATDDLAEGNQSAAQLILESVKIPHRLTSTNYYYDFAQKLVDSLYRSSVVVLTNDKAGASYWNEVVLKQRACGRALEPVAFARLDWDPRAESGISVENWEGLGSVDEHRSFLRWLSRLNPFRTRRISSPPKNMLRFNPLGRHLEFTLKTDQEEYPCRFVTLLTPNSTGAQGFVCMLRRSDLDDGQPALCCKLLKQHEIQQSTTRSKLVYMVTLPTPHPQVCWPTGIVHDPAGHVRGFSMPLATGTGLTSLATLLDEQFPAFPARWDRRHLVKIALVMTGIVEAVHRGIPTTSGAVKCLIGDVSLRNILVNVDSEFSALESHVWIVDADSFSVGEFRRLASDPLRPEFQGPRVLKHRKAKTEYFVTEDDDLYSLAILIFGIVMYGVHPFSHRGSQGSAEQNILRGEFPYQAARMTGREPSAAAAARWSHLTYQLREQFCRTFHDRKVVYLAEWQNVLKEYLGVLQKDDLCIDSRQETSRFDRNPSPATPKKKAR